MAIRQIFTFQSGDIQIYDADGTQIAEFVFTFQSGDIQIKLLQLGRFTNISIYIPIW